MFWFKSFVVLLLCTAGFALYTKPYGYGYSRNLNFSAVQPFPDFVKALEYPVETHTITTDDGYILTYFRIQAKEQGYFKTGLPVVFLMHGFTDSGDTWVIDDEDDAPGFQLANHGYDVWVGNARGTKYCMSHVTLNSSDPAFWQFSWQNMTHYDLPAAFKYINSQTGELINYIGHSQGTTIMFAALADREPLVLQYLRKYVALSPVAWVQHIKSGPMYLIAHSTLATLLNKFHINQFLPSDFLESDFGHIFCKTFANDCGNFLKFLVGADPQYDNYAQYDIIMEHEPGGTSTMDALHWRQEVLQAKFNKYDYGTDENLRQYNQTTPPDYNVTNIDVPVYMFIGSDDTLVDPRDTQTLLDNLSGSPHVQYKMYPAGHMTFIWSKNISFYFGDLLQILESDEDVMLHY